MVGLSKQANCFKFTIYQKMVLRLPTGFRQKWPGQSGKHFFDIDGQAIFSSAGQPFSYEQEKLKKSRTYR
jgi:hypothetical protein